MVKYSMCLFCFSGDPHPDDPYGDRVQKFQRPMCEAGCADPCCCCCTFFFWPIPLCVLRRRYLHASGDEYSCCQSRTELFCGIDRQCSPCCMCLEVSNLPALSMSATRNAVRELYHLGSDTQDRQLIRLSNCLQCLACICDCAAICFEELRDGARALQHVANCVTFSVIGCMASQVRYELNSQSSKNAGGGYYQVGGNGGSGAFYS